MPAARSANELQPNWYGSQVLPASAYFPSGFDGQVDGPAVARLLLVEPDRRDLECWARSCLACDEFHGYPPDGGWAPGRSGAVLCIEVVGLGVALSKFYYKVKDHGENDVAYVRGRPNPADAAECFLRHVATWVEAMAALVHQGKVQKQRVMETLGRELATWDGPLVREVVGLRLLTERSRRLFGTYQCRLLLLRWAVRVYHDATHRMARAAA